MPVAIMAGLPSAVTWLPGEARSASTPRPNELAGTQTVPSARSAISAGRVTDPRSPVRVTVCPMASYTSADTRTTGTRAVAR